MQRKWHWPLITVVLTSFLLGAAWGIKLIRDRAESEGRLEADAVLNILAPTGFLPKELLIEFQKQERVQVVLHEEPFPSALLRRALKASPGQFDLIIAYHYQVSALRNERRLTSLYDSRVKFPTNIAPDFRKLPDDRNLMDTAPLQWGLLGVATPAAPTSASVSAAKTTTPRLGFWPAILIGGETSELPPQNFVSSLRSATEDLRQQQHEKYMSRFQSASVAEIEEAVMPPSYLVVSHGSLAFAPLKDLKFELRPIKSQSVSDLKSENFMLWVLTAVALSDGDLERSRKLVRFLLDPVQNLKLVQHTKTGATTLRNQDGFEQLPKQLQSNYFRTFPIDQIRIERDERVRQVDDLLEQAVLGAAIVSKATPTPAPTPKPVAAAPPPKAPKPAIKIESVEKTETGEAVVPTSDQSPPVPIEQPEPQTTAPSEEPLPAD